MAAVATAADVSLEVDGTAIPIPAFAWWTLIGAAAGRRVGPTPSRAPTVRRRHHGRRRPVAHPADRRARRHRHQSRSRGEPTSSRRPSSSRPSAGSSPRSRAPVTGLLSARSAHDTASVTDGTASPTLFRRSSPSVKVPVPGRCRHGSAPHLHHHRPARCHRRRRPHRRRSDGDAARPPGPRRRDRRPRRAAERHALDPCPLPRRRRAARPLGPPRRGPRQRRSADPHPHVPLRGRLARQGRSRTAPASTTCSPPAVTCSTPSCWPPPRRRARGADRRVGHRHADATPPDASPASPLRDRDGTQPRARMPASSSAPTGSAPASPAASGPAPSRTAARPARPPTPTSPGSAPKASSSTSGDRAFAGVFPTHGGEANVWVCTPAEPPPSASETGSTGSSTCSAGASLGAGGAGPGRPDHLAGPFGHGPPEPRPRSRRTRLGARRRRRLPPRPDHRARDHRCVPRRRAARPAAGPGSAGEVVRGRGDGRLRRRPRSLAGPDLRRHLAAGPAPAARAVRRAPEAAQRS